MSCNVFIVPMLFCILVWDSCTVCGQQKNSARDLKDPRVGKKVMVTKAGAELRTPQATVWKGYLGDVFTVDLTNGEWLWINEKGGWLWEKEAIPFDAAIQLLSERIEKQKTSENYHLRGVAYLAHKQYDPAIADFNESLRLQPQNAGALNNRGQTNYLKGAYKAAADDYAAAIAIDANNPLVLNNRALAYIELNDHDNAMNDLQAALKLVPHYPEALNNRGVVNQRLGKSDEAIADFSEALKLDPKYVGALENRAFSYVQKNDHPKAIADLESALQHSPGSSEAANDLAWLLATTSEDSVRDIARALVLAKQACTATEFKQWNMLDTLATVYAENNEFAEAGKFMEAAINLAPAEEKQRLQIHLDLVTAGKPVRD
jgi:tetratricopeptide (TPR) repeat protein